MKCNYNKSTNIMCNSERTLILFSRNLLPAPPNFKVYTSTRLLFYPQNYFDLMILAFKNSFSKQLFYMQLPSLLLCFLLKEIIWTFSGQHMVIFFYLQNLLVIFAQDSSELWMTSPFRKMQSFGRGLPRIKKLRNISGKIQ